MTQGWEPLEYPGRQGVVYDSEVGVRLYKHKSAAKKVFSYYISYLYQKQETRENSFGGATLARQGLTHINADDIATIRADLAAELHAQPETVIILNIIPLPITHPGN